MGIVKRKEKRWSQILRQPDDKKIFLPIGRPDYIFVNLLREDKKKIKLWDRTRDFFNSRRPNDWRLIKRFTYNPAKAMCQPHRKTRITDRNR